MQFFSLLFLLSTIYAAPVGEAAAKAVGQAVAESGTGALTKVTMRQRLTAVKGKFQQQVAQSQKKAAMDSLRGKVSKTVGPESKLPKKRMSTLAKVAIGGGIFAAGVGTGVALD